MHDFSPFYSPYAPALMAGLISLVLIVATWTVVIKGYALWYAARASQTGWFIALLAINTVGILEIIYLVWFRSATSRTPAHHSSAQA